MMIPQPFNKKELVICIAQLCNSEPGEKIPEVAHPYTIRDIRYLPQRNMWVVQLAEIVNKRRRYKEGLEEIWFDATAFTPANIIYIDITAKLAKEAEFCEPNDLHDLYPLIKYLN